LILPMYVESRGEIRLGPYRSKPLCAALRAKSRHGLSSLTAGFAVEEGSEMSWSSSSAMSPGERGRRVHRLLRLDRESDLCVLAGHIL
jgi:hypothetical protein